MNPLKNRVLSPTIRARMRGESGFSMLELLLVMGILMILIGILSISGVEIMEKSRKETALKGIAAMFRHARQGALTTNQPRRIVLEMSYDSQASTPREAYELGPKLEYWVEKKVIRNQGWESGYEQVIGPNEMPPGSTLIDINGNALIPENLTDGRLNKNGTYSYFTVIEFNSKGTIVAAYQEDRGPNGNQIFTPEDQRQVLRPLALHFIFTSPDIDVSEANPPGEIYDYISFLRFGTGRISDPAPMAQELQQIVTEARSDPTNDQEFVARLQVHTLYILRLTGQTASYDYGIYEPWPVQTLPEDLEGPV